MSFLSSIAMIALMALLTAAAEATRECVVNYSVYCAEGWTPSMIYHRVCVAPISYNGPCAANLPFVETKEDKQHLEKACNIQWPCYMDCSPDFSASCPLYWYFSEGMCMRSAAYHGRCKQPIDLGRMQESEKELWGNRCGVKWPCQKKCKKNYNSRCPEGWEHKGNKQGESCFTVVTGNGRCVAPESYAGPCFPNADLSFFSIKQKQEFENLCNVTFPCS